MEELYKTNPYQTKITQELMNSLEKEVQEDFWFYINNVPFIQNLISPNRKKAKDLPRDSTGRIHVNLSDPHILENMNFFRETAMHFQEHGCYTKLRINTSPKSEYMKWFNQELDRCWNGMVRPEDGEWITGDMYFYLNYLIMRQTVIKKSKTGRDIGMRVDTLPECWEGVYWRFHYLDQARNAGLHCAEIASRGKSKSYTLASLLTKAFTVGINKESKNGRNSMIVADNKEFLIKEGTLNKFEAALNHLSENTQFPSALYQSSMEVKD